MSFFDKMIEIAKSMGVKNFAYYKKWALDHLKKQLDEDKQVTKAIEWCEEYLEKAYGVGTIRTWKGKKYIKGPDKKWRRYYDKHGRGTSIAISHIMKQINALEDGDFEGLYEIIQKNAGRFRDQNGNVLPEVQQIHDLVEKKQAGSENTESKLKAAKEDLDKKTKAKAAARDKYGVDSKEFKDAEKEENAAADKRNALRKEFEKEAAKKRHEMWNKKETTKEEKKETEQEKHDNRSNAMKGNQNAKKDFTEQENKEIIRQIKRAAEQSNGTVEGTFHRLWLNIVDFGAFSDDLHEKFSSRFNSKDNGKSYKENNDDLKELIASIISNNDNVKKDGVSDEELKTMTTYQLKKRLGELEKGEEYNKIQDELNKREEEEDKKNLQVNVDGIKDQLRHKSETEVKKYFNRLDKQFADKPENSIEKRAIAQAKADYYGDSAFKDTNLEKVADKYANNKKVDKLINDTTVDSFVCDDKTGTRYFMTGVYNDPDGYKVATDGHYLYAEKADIPEDKTGQIINKDGQKIEGIFPNWKRVIPDNAPKTDLFDDKKGLMKLCLIGNKISKLTKNVPCKVKVGDFAYDSKLLGKVLAIADKQGLNNVSVTGNGQILFEGDKGKATLAGMAFDFGGSYLDANDKMFYGAQPDAVKEFLGTSEDITDPETEKKKEEKEKKEKEESEKNLKEFKELNDKYEPYGIRLNYANVHGEMQYTIDRKIDGRWVIGGRGYSSDKERNMKLAEKIYENEKAGEEWRKKQEEKKENEEKAKQERAAGYGSFFDGKDAKTKARVMNTLEKRVNFGNGKVMSYKEYIDKQFADGDLEVKTHEENKLKGPSRRAYNRMDGRQQEEYERRIKEAGKKTVYEIRSKANGGYYDLGKYAYDYAKYLLENGGVKKSFVSQIREIMQKSGPAEPKHDLEFFKKWALSILDKQKEEPENEDEPNEDTIVKALAYTEMIAKAGYPVGTIREWKGKKYIKVAPNQWKPKYDKVDRGAKMSLGHLKKAVANANSEEELYNIINSNASRFRDENGRPFPEVQELHDLVTKRQGELNPGENSGENGTETSGAAGNGGTSSKEKGKTSYADQIAAIQKLGKKAESAVQNTGSGHVDNAIENAANDVVESTKNAAKKEDTKKKTAAEIVDTGKEMTDEDKDKWLKQFEGGEENGPEESKKTGKVSEEEKFNAVAEFLSKQGGSVEEWKEQLGQLPKDFVDGKYKEILASKENEQKPKATKKTKDEEGAYSRAEDEQDKRIGGSALWDQHVKNAIKSGNVDKIKTAIAQVENEYNELSKKAKYQDEKEFLMYELKFRKRDAENAIKDLQKK